MEYHNFEQTHNKKNKDKDKDKDKSKTLSNIIQKYTDMYSLTIIFIVCVILSFSLAYFFNYKNSKSGGLQELILLANKSCYHIHHSITMTLMITCLIIGRYIKSNKTLVAILGVYVGMVAEDFLYKDWFMIKNNCHKKQLIKYMKQTVDVFKKYN